MRHDSDPTDADDAPFPPPDPALEAAVAAWVARAGEPVDVEAALARVTARRRAADAALATGTPAPTSPRDDLAERRARRAASVAAPRRRLVPWAVAAGLALVAGSLLLPRTRSTAPSSTTFATAQGTIDTLDLADGTRVVLGPASTLVVAVGAGAGERAVQLDGEATFTVTHDAARPFVVRTAAGELLDLGTVFSVRAVAGGDLAVRVTEGEVELRPRRDATTAVRLRAGDAATLVASRLAVERGRAVPGDVAALAQGRLAFREAPITEVRDALRRWYGVTLVVDDALRLRHVTGDFTDEPPRRVATVLALALAADATWRGDTVLLRARPAPR